MDAYFGYNQIKMSSNDEEKIAFISNWRLYYYNAMSFGLKNADASYQRLVNQMFKQQISWNMEVYLDDLLVKSKKPEKHLADLCDAFSVLWRYKKRLNQSKCAFGVKSEKLLGFMVSERKIEVNPKKVEAIVGMLSPQPLRSPKVGWLGSSPELLHLLVDL